MNIILASQSPRRRELLARLPINFSVASCDIDESVVPNEQPHEYLVRMVQTKASAYISLLKQQVSPQQLPVSSQPSNVQTLILTADTIGVMPNSHDILVKPTDKADALRMWHAMSDNTHFVWTAVKATLINDDMQVIWEDTIIEKTEVAFIPLTTTDMEAYWQTGEPSDKAGAYAIQGLAAAWVARINGSYTNVVGLPLAQTKCLIDAALQQDK